MRRDIEHWVEIAAAPEVVMAALDRPAPLAHWWTREVEADGRVATLHWSGHGWRVQLEIAADPGPQRVLWRCLRSNMLGTTAWEGSTIHFELTPIAAGTRLDFAQRGYAPSPCFDTCARGWAFFLGASLKQYVETGTGIPYPDMVDAGGPVAP